MTDNLTVLCIEHKSGCNMHICDSVRTAFDILNQYVQANWNTHHDGKIPEDLEIATEIYFDINDNYESYSTECHLTILTADDVVYKKESQPNGA